MRPIYSIAIALIALALAGDGRAAINLSFNGTTSAMPGLVVAPPPSAPAAPLSSVLGPKTSATMTLVWSDGATNEQGYRIERQVGTTWTLVANLPPVGASVIGFGTSYKVTGLTHNTRYCHRVVPYNSLGSTPGPSLCATTTRVSGPITVVVSDLQGLQGELDDLTPLAYPPTAQLAAGPAASPFPIPAARKIVYVADSASIRIPPGAKFQLQAGVHLVGGRRGTTRGALLYTDATFATEMIRVVGDGVRISGLRLRGPSAGTSEDLAQAVGVLVRNVLDVVVDHCEIYNWTSAGIEVRHELGMIHAMTADRVRITENYFHHNQREGDSGYGVGVRDASYARIDKNTFDWNRHAVAADGGADVIVPGYGPEQGYFANLNLVLPGHSDQDGFATNTYDTHHFDVHGTEPGTFLNAGDGWAGEFFEVAHNSFIGIEGLALYVRGTPSEAAYFQHNVVGHIEYDDGAHGYAVDDESDRDNVVNYANTNVPDPRGRLGVGDFDGDGRDDVFLATGQAWYVSYGGITEWRFFAPFSSAISGLWFLDYDGDGRTDVLWQGERSSVWYVWSNGNLTSLATTPVVPAQNFYSGSDLIGDFSGDDVLDRLRFDRTGDRYFRTIDGRTGAAGQSRHQM